MPAKATEADFWRNVNRRGADECWLWLGLKIWNGYGIVHRRPRGKITAHRLAYEYAVGRIPDGAEVDHVCHNRDASCEGGYGCPHRACVNPAHLEAVTPSTNRKRGRNGMKRLAATTTRCSRGHEFTKMGNRRICRTCANAASARYRARRRSASV